MHENWTFALHRTRVGRNFLSIIIPWLNKVTYLLTYLFKAIPLFCTCFALRITSIAYNIANFNGGGDFHQSPEKKGKKDSLYSPNHFNSCSDNSPDLNGIGLETRRSPFA